MPSLRGPVRPAAPLAIALHIRKVMRIAQVAPLFERVPPPRYGGTERVVAYLTDELDTAGHDVTLFASADSGTSAAGDAAAPRASARGRRARSTRAKASVVQSEAAPRAQVRRDPPPRRLPGVLRSRAGSRADAHSPGGSIRLPPGLRHYGEEPVVSISDAQREPLPHLTWAGTVHHGLPPNLYAYHPTRRLPRLPRPHLAREAAGPRHRDRAEPAYRCGSPPRSTPRSARTSTAVGRCSTTRSSSSSARSATPRRRSSWAGRGAAVPDRLAGAVRARDDRGDGVRHAGDRVAPRLGARGHRRTA